MAKILNLCFVVFFGLLILSTNTHGGAINKRSTETETVSPKKECLNNTPCGWAVYTPFTRNIDYFMKNTCECETAKACIKTDDDLSVSAYVYRCRFPRRAAEPTPAS